MYVGYALKTAVTHEQCVLVKAKTALLVHLEVVYRAFGFTDEQYLTILTIYHD